MLTGPVPQSRPPRAAGDAHPVGERRAERPRHDVREPERDDRVEPEPPVRDRRHRDDDGEHDAGREVAEVQRCRGQVAGGGAERERRQHGRPVEHLATPRRRCCGSTACVSSRCQTTKIAARTSGEERGRHAVRDAEADVQHVGGHRAEHTDHRDREPVDPRRRSGGPRTAGRARQQARAPPMPTATTGAACAPGSRTSSRPCRS